MKKIVLLVFVACFAGCSNTKQKGLVYYNDFENIKGWTEVLLEKKPVHGGIYSNRLDSVHIYGETFKLNFKEIADYPLKKVKISFWVFIQNASSKGKLVLEINQPDKKNVFWIAKNLENYVSEYDKWVEVKEEFSFVNKDIMIPQNLIKIFVWNLSKQEMYVDDVRIEFVL